MNLTGLSNLCLLYTSESFTDNERIWIEDDGLKPKIRTDKRVGIDYAGEEWASKPWRFILDK